MVLDKRLQALKKHYMDCFSTLRKGLNKDTTIDFPSYVRGIEDCLETLLGRHQLCQLQKKVLEESNQLD